MKRSSLSLKWLEVFELAAQRGSVQAVAEETGLSVSTVSHHIRALESALGVALLDHSRRPMVVTAAGAAFLRDVDAGLRLIRRAETQARAGPLPETRALSLALIEDFDSEIAPELARMLAEGMPRCVFRHLTRPSHEILQLLRNRDIDLGVATRPQFEPPELGEYPLLRDPFVLAAPAGSGDGAEAHLAGETGLPLLRYTGRQIIGAQIEAHLRRLRIDLPNRFEFESNQSIMGLVAAGGGWAITTPLNFMRARRFHRDIALMPFPGKGFARTVSLFAPEDHAGAAADTVTGALRQLIQARAIDPAVERMPWLADQFRLAESEPVRES
ncbi:LysR family transcriptional regulator [Roseovarius spongiae]|uniref:LysR family transcriptional regulator n=1 Tax=Roseovarius spongiae TaxID=2320272 RepID=A0A3A8AX99_9RHOB|nr:LysR family transcriptional regulator [Roseovarius spongiae]RKF15440.1 LysR family transcriptional regulator [Roseovarius spongiae]